MRLYGILSWYDEPPTWLAATVSSLKRIGVDHVIAVDGRYPHFEAELPGWSPPEQAEAIMLACDALGMGLTLAKQDPMMEPDKRTYCFKLLNAIAEPFVDWCVIIDADELMWEGTPSVKDELASLKSPVHCAACKIAVTVDPYGEPGPDNDITPGKTVEIHVKLPVPRAFRMLQSRFWRVMPGMRTDHTHFGFYATDEDGREVNIRPRLGADPADGVAEIHTLASECMILHRKNHRTHARRSAKKAYYTLRNELGLERA